MTRSLKAAGIWTLGYFACLASVIEDLSLLGWLVVGCGTCLLGVLINYMGEGE